MRLLSLEVSNLRNLQSVSLLPHPNTNFVIGANGSGKTSLLESIALLSNGRSFRTPDSKKLIRHGSDQLVVFSAIESEHSGKHRVGISKSGKGITSAKLDGKLQQKVSALAKVFPVISIETNSMELIEGGPSLRRSLLDWGMFHVEHRFLEIWGQYRAGLKQKNALLKSGKKVNTTELQHWNRVIAHFGERLDIERTQYCDALIEQFGRIRHDYFESELEIQFRYRPGWDKATFVTLEQCLSEKMESEIQRASCLYGPHRADLDILWNGSLAKDICSRGQKKLVLYGVRLAQIAYMMRKTGVSPILLLDDLPAELDEKNINNVIRFLKEFPCQTFITAISDQSITQEMLSAFEEHKMFHVEHGTFEEIR
ncbi:DNA replication/repair protein RecF [Ketobacter sp.]|uniref:DNA replication/repair protein RecF n=1 Tax=Ketobacter sp. TaxID=2083498 RepID=UPI000F201324|nr:DNA replication/repair protein RecF [Ketobacter sp.]RLT96036.1 MAG: DNA replication/repair protein RecF [Ketobacter sp.]